MSINLFEEFEKLRHRSSTKMLTEEEQKPELETRDNLSAALDKLLNGTNTRLWIKSASGALVKCKKALDAAGKGYTVISVDADEEISNEQAKNYYGKLLKTNSDVIILDLRSKKGIEHDLEVLILALAQNSDKPIIVLADKNYNTDRPIEVKYSVIDM